MMDLLPAIVPSLWAKISALIWMGVFVLIAVRIFRPGSKGRYETHGKLPLDE